MFFSPSNRLKNIFKVRKIFISDFCVIFKVIYRFIKISRCFGSKIN
jgi:hypothetical protein